MLRQNVARVTRFLRRLPACLTMRLFSIDFPSGVELVPGGGYGVGGGVGVDRRQSGIGSRRRDKLFEPEYSCGGYFCSQAFGGTGETFTNNFDSSLGRLSRKG
jgi:hypothetical protein